MNDLKYLLEMSATQEEELIRLREENHKLRDLVIQLTHWPIKDMVDRNLKSLIKKLTGEITP